MVSFAQVINLIKVFFDVINASLLSIFIFPCWCMFGKQVVNYVILVCRNDFRAYHIKSFVMEPNLALIKLNQWSDFN